mgnify:CR=1 FL=1
MTKAELKKEVKIEKKKKGIFGIRKKTKKKEKKEEVKEPVIYLPLKEEYEIVEEYWIKEPYARVVIATIPELGYQKTYFVQEEKLTPDERKAVDKLIDILSVELQPPETFEVDVRKHVLEEARRLIQKYRKAIKSGNPRLLGEVQREMEIINRLQAELMKETFKPTIATSLLFLFVFWIIMSSYGSSAVLALPFWSPFVWFGPQHYVEYNSEILSGISAFWWYVATSISISSVINVILKITGRRP